MVTTASNASHTRRLSPKKILIKLLYSPLIWLAVGAHVLLLVVPFDPSVKTEEVVEEPEAEIVESIPVDILNLSAIASSTPPPEAAPPAPVSAAPPAPVSVPTPVEVPAPPVVNEAPAEAQPENLRVEALPLEDAPVEESPAYYPSADSGVFLESINRFSEVGIQTYGDQLPTENSFSSKGNGQSFLVIGADITQNSSPVDGALNAIWMDKNLDQILPLLSQTYGGDFAPVGEYAQEPVYELRNPQGEVVIHVSLVSLKGSTLLVTWESSPLGTY